MTLTESTLDSLPEAVSCSTHVHETYHKNEIPTLSSEALERTSGRSGSDDEPHLELCSSVSETLQGEARFKAEEWLARGGYGEVWRGTDQKLHRPVAIKSYLGQTSVAQASYQDEVRLVERLAHPGIPAIYDVSGLRERSPYIVMQLVEGVTLKELIQRLQAGDEETHAVFHFHHRMDLILQLLRVLTVVHERGILHRDIKPENLMIGETGELYLMDWGIAVEQGADQGAEGISGTPLYMSPEQFAGQPATVRSELYSVGAVAYELMTLKRTVEGSTVYQVGMNIISGSIIPADLNPHPTQGTVPSEFGKVIMKALSMDPEARFQSAKEMRLELARVLGGYFDVVCPRTALKQVIFRYLRWVDRAPVSRVALTTLLLIGLIGGVLFMGVALGLWLSTLKG